MKQMQWHGRMVASAENLDFVKPDDPLASGCKGSVLFWDYSILLLSVSHELVMVELFIGSLQRSKISNTISMEKNTDSDA
jgi:hypothetical protein